MYITNYPMRMPLIAVSQEYHHYVKNIMITNRIIITKSDGYPAEIVQLKTAIDKLRMRRGD